MFGTNFKVPSKYINLQPIGLGAFGMVCSASSSQTPGITFAIKKIVKPFENTTLAKRAFRELMLLSHLNHENIICLRDAFFSNEPVDLYFVTDLLGY
jgi:p38 MAP kinase